MTRLPRHWFGRHSGGTGRRYGADIALRRTPAGRFILLRHGRVLWRSQGLFRNDGADTAFGPHLFAFAAYRHGIFVTDLEHRERLIMRGRGLYPYAFTRSGELLVTRSNGRVTVIAPDGSILRRYRFRPRNGFTFDQRTETLYLVRPDRMLAAVEGTHLRAIRRLRGIEGTMAFVRPGLLVFTSRRSVAIVRLDGTLVARARWRRSAIDVLDSGPIVSPDGRSFAFRLSDAHPGAERGTAVLYVLRSGESRARVIFRHRLGPIGCVVGANMFWHGRYLLYSSIDGQRAVFDSRGRRVIGLERLARALPHRGPGEEADVYWVSDFAR